MSEHIQFETNGVTVLVVPVPDDAQDFEIESLLEEDFCQLNYLTENTDVDSGFCGDWEGESIDLPVCDWSIHAVTPEITEEQARALTVEMRDSGYPFEFQDRRETLEDVLRSHGIDPKQKNVLLINRKK